MQPHRIGEQLDSYLAERDGETVVSLLDQRATCLHRAVEYDGQIEPFLAQLELPGRDSSEIQQISDESPQMADLTLDRPILLLDIGVGGTVQPEDLHSVLDHPDWRAHLMREDHQGLIRREPGRAVISRPRPSDFGLRL